jgi:hypothetical protein
MSVFDQQPITATRNPQSNVCKDREVPISNGVADGSVIGTPNFLSGIKAGVADNLFNGVVQIIINGDQVEEVRGTKGASILGDCDTHIHGSLKTLVDGREERAVLSGRSTFIGRTGIPLGGAQIGMETTRVQGDRFVTIVGNETLIVTGSLQKTVVAGEVENEVAQIWKSFGGWRGEYGGYDAKLCFIGAGTALPINTDIRLVNTDFTIGQVGLTLSRTEGLGIQGQLVGGDGKLGVVKLISGGICNKMDLFGS